MDAAIDQVFQSTDLARNHREVVEVARKRGGAIIRDKDGTALLLTQAGDVARQADLLHHFRDLVQLQWILAATQASMPDIGFDGLAIQITEPGLYGDLAWVAVLSRADQEHFAYGLMQLLIATRGGQSLDALEEYLANWQATAETWRDEALRAELTGDVDEPLHDVTL